MYDKIRRNIKHPEKLIIKLGKISGLIPDKLYLKAYYYNVFGKKLDLKNPKTFNEKLQWLKLYDRRPEYTMMVDKYKVRDYVSELIGEEHLIPLLGVWDDPDEIDFESLPNQFVLKCNHNSAVGMCICKDKTKLNIEEVKEKLRNGLSKDYYLSGREWPYKDVPRKIICEKYMTDSENEDLPDYKIHSFNGIPKVILVCSKRFKEEGLHEDFFNKNWEKLELKRPNAPNSEQQIPKPKELIEMLEFSEKISKNIPFARTDFYVVDGKIYFGEITFYPASGLESFSPEKWDEILGDWIKLPVCENVSGGVIQ